MGLRERKKQETRAALSWAAIRLIVERGADNVLVEDIAAAAGVSPRTFNNYFSSKGEAVASRHLDRILRMAADLRERPAAEPLWDAITEAALAQLEPGPEVTAHPVGDLQAWADGVRAMVSSPALQAEMLRAGATAERSVAEAVAARTGTDAEADLYPKLVAAAVLAAVNVVSGHAMTKHAATTDVRDLMREALADVRAGLPPPNEPPNEPPN
jgi:AcrR family transcriptional regulator